MKSLVLSFILLPLLAKTQEIVKGDIQRASYQRHTITAGIQWTTGLTWRQIKDKAKADNKYIFIDCYTTWCGPCKWMDKNVYSNDTVGNYINPRFISIKVQMDTSKLDDDEIKAWYNDAHQIMKENNVASFPTFLFFSSSGELLHQEMGAKMVQQFVQLGTDALDEKKQYYTRLKLYRSGRMSYKDMTQLARDAAQRNDPICKKIANDYIENYLLVRHDFLYSKDDYRFICQFTKSSKDKGFEIIYNSSEKVNQLLSNRGYAQSLLHSIIMNEEIEPIIKAFKKNEPSPNWESLIIKVKTKYNKYYAYRAVLDAKRRYYAYQRDIDEFIKYLVSYISKYGDGMSNSELNGNAWVVVKYGKKKLENETAAHWMRKVVSNETDSANLLPAALDTYANLLYKTGQKEKAIATEEEALKLALKFDIDNFVIDFKRNLNKMKNDEVIW